MKIICPEHKGYAGVPDEDLTYARINPSKILVLNCPVCHAEVQIRNIDLLIAYYQTDKPSNLVLKIKNADL